MLTTVYHIAETLEKHYKDMQDMEFTIEKANSSCSRPGTARGPLPQHENSR